MNSDNKKLVIFDFDGVLINTLDFAFASYKELNKDFTWEKFQDFSNGNFHETVGSEINNGFCSPEDKKWDEIYSRHIRDLKVVDIIVDTIKKLALNYVLAIVSSTSTQCINDFLLKEKITNFSDILGTDVHKSKIIKINSLLEKYNIKPDCAVFITDSLGDILEGNACGIKSIGVTWGIHPKETLKKGNPIAVLDDPRDLLDCIKNVLPL
jgi:phosphoglycolate phosphatase-like HAD superfamily hydrolase